MKKVLTATAILLSIACASFGGSVSAASFDSNVDGLLLAQAEIRNQEPRDKVDNRAANSERDRRADGNTYYYASRTTKGVSKIGLT